MTAKDFELRATEFVKIASGGPAQIAKELASTMLAVFNEGLAAGSEDSKERSLRLSKTILAGAISSLELRLRQLDQDLLEMKKS